MITYIKIGDSDLYTIASEASGLKIENFNDYINALSSLPTKYTRLSLDEDVFEIDANARTITVPTSFSKNGVGVVGDKLAEVIYFKINRYFDAMDLNELDAYIQWETPDGAKGVSKAYNKSAEQEDGEEYVYFGWALSSKLTAKAGSIKFNIRLISETDNILNYSFSTQTASISIKAGLDYDFIANEALIETIEPSDIQNILLGKNVNYKPTVGSIASTAKVGDKLTIEASVPEGSNIFYKWYHDDEQITDAYTNEYTIPETDALGEYYVSVISSTKVTDKQTKNTEGETVDYDYHTVVLTSNSNSCVVSGPKAITIVGQMSNKYVIGETSEDLILTFDKEEDDGTITVKVLKYDTESGEYKDTETTLTPDLTGSAKVVRFAPTEVGNYELSLTNSLNNVTTEAVVSNFVRVTEPAEITSVEVQFDGVTVTTELAKDSITTEKPLTAKVEAPESDALTYSWYMVAGDAQDPEDDIEDIQQVSTEATFVPEAQGQYYVVVTNNVNGNTTSKKSAPITVNA